MVWSLPACMAINFNHTIVWARDSEASATFLAQLLGYSEITERTHREVCQFFVQKDPSIANFREFAEADTDQHDRLLWLPRGGFKSSLNIVDCVQYIVCWPDIRLNIMPDGIGEAVAILHPVRLSGK